MRITFVALSFFAEAELSRELQITLQSSKPFPQEQLDKLLNSAKKNTDELKKIELLFGLSASEKKLVMDIINSAENLLKNVFSQKSFEDIESALYKFVDTIQKLNLDTILKPQLFIASISSNIPPNKN